MVACSRTNAAMIRTMPDRVVTGDSSFDCQGLASLVAAAARTAALRWVIMIAVVVMLRTATAAMASRMARLPYRPMMNVASGGPATQAADTIARVLTMSAARAPECRRWAYSIELPTPAGPPITTRAAMVAIGSYVVRARATASRKVSAPQTSIGPR